MKIAVKVVKKELDREKVDAQETGLQDQREETYRIYEYLKKNPGFFAGSGAVIVAVLSALLKFCSYLYERSVLKYWNIDPVYINLDAASRWYGTIAGFVLVCILFALVFMIDMLGEKGMPVRQKVLYLKRIKREYRKEMFKKKVNRFCALFSRVPCDKSLADHSFVAREKIEQLEKTLKEQSAETSKHTIRYLFIGDIVLTLSLWIWVCAEMIDSSGPVLLMVLLSFLASTILIAVMYLSARNAFVDKRRIKEMVAHQYKSLEIGTDVPSISFPLKKILSGDYCIKQSDRKIKRATAVGLMIVLFFVVAVLVLFQIFGYQKAKCQTQFMVTSLDGIEYAIIYNSGENAVIAQCRGSNNVLTIDASHQKVIAVEGLEYIIRQYEKVEQNAIITDGEIKGSVGNGTGDK